ncbi:MAG: DUF3048 domain-containing protein [Ruminococcaceae bacterium]|nr:DUF3048 domain-containing protein [Oscillospiraceae bacterium]
MKHLKNSKITKTLSLVLALVFIIGSFAGCGGDKEEPTTTTPPTTKAPATEPPVTVIKNPLTGEGPYDEALLGNRPVLISVENHKDARPQWGLTSSDIVWEMEAEGGITRMLLMYADASRIPAKVGPVRSARHYFVDLAEGFDAIFVHFGFSPQAKSQIANHGVNNINGLYDNYFYRDKSRNVDSEHTAYTTDEAIAKAIANKDYRTTLEEDYKNPFKFNDKAVKLADGECTAVTVYFSNYCPYSYTYDEAKNVYLSSLNGKPFADSEGTQQNFENIIMCFADVSRIAGDDKSRNNIDLSEGEGTYISNGTYEKITWKKGDSADMMKFYNAKGEELSLNPGRTHIAIIDEGNEDLCKIS